VLIGSSPVMQNRAVMCPRYLSVVKLSRLSGCVARWRSTAWFSVRAGKGFELPICWIKFGGCPGWIVSELQVDLSPPNKQGSVGLN